MSIGNAVAIIATLITWFMHFNTCFMKFDAGFSQLVTIYLDTVPRDPQGRFWCERPEYAQQSWPRCGINVPDRIPSHQPLQPPS